MALALAGSAALLAGCHATATPTGCGDLPPSVPARPFAIVGDRASDRLELYALAPALARVGCWSVDENPGFVDEPFDIAVAPPGLGDAIYVVLGHADRYAAGTLLKLRATDGARLGEVTLGEEPSMVALSADGTRAYVTLFRNLAHPKGPFSDPGALVVVDTAAMRVLGSVEVCAAPLGVALDEARQTAWVACLGGDALALVDLRRAEAPRLSRTVPLVDAAGPGVGPAYVEVDGDAGAGHAFVSAQGSGELWAFDLASAAPVARLPFGSASFPQRLALSGDRARLWVAVDGAERIAAIAPVAVLTATVVALPGVHPQGIALDRAGRYALITDEGDLQSPGRLVRVDLADLSTTTAPTAVFPQAVRIVY